MKSLARGALFSSPSSELSLPLSTVSEPQSSSSSSSLDEDSSCWGNTEKMRTFKILVFYNNFILHYLMLLQLTPDPFLRNLLASGAGSGFFLRKDLAVTATSASSSLSDEPFREVQVQF